VVESLTASVEGIAAHGTANPLHFEKWLTGLVEVRRALAGFVGAKSEHEIALTSSGTDAINRLVRSLAWQRSDRVVLPDNEFVSNCAPWLRLRDQGVSIALVRTAEDGMIDLQHLRALLSSQTRLVSVSHTPNSIGAMQPIAEIGAIAAERGVLFHLNACPTIGQVSLDVDDVGCTFMTATARKYLRGPATGGFLYVREAALGELRPPSIGWMTGSWDANSQSLEPWRDARMFHDGHPLFADWLALGEAVAYVASLGGMASVARRVSEVSRCALEELSGRKNLVVYGPRRPQDRAALISFGAPPRTPREVVAFLRERGIVAEAGNFLCPVPLAKNGVSEAARISVHYTNSIEELTFVGRVLDELPK